MTNVEQNARGLLNILLAPKPERVPERMCVYHLLELFLVQLVAAQQRRQRARCLVWDTQAEPKAHGA